LILIGVLKISKVIIFINVPYFYFFPVEAKLSEADVNRICYDRENFLKSC